MNVEGPGVPAVARLAGLRVDVRAQVLLGAEGVYESAAVVAIDGEHDLLTPRGEGRARVLQVLLQAAHVAGLLQHVIGKPRRRRHAAA